MRNVAGFRRKVNNAGMTLVELIVAIAIVTVAIIPLMFGFIFVLKNNLRAREVQQTTVLAHTVMENCKAYAMDDISSKVSNGTFLTGVSSTQGHMIGDNVALDGAPLGERNFDVLVTITDHGMASNLLDYKEMNAYNDAVFQSQYAMSMDSTPVAATEVDNLAYFAMLEALKQKAYDTANSSTSLTDEQKATFNVSLSTLDESFKTGGINSGVEYNLKREITISAHSVGSVDYATVTYKYSYALSGAYTVKWLRPDNINYWSITVPADSSDSDWVTATKHSFNIYDNTETTSNTELQNIYFFYYPAYAANDDDIVAFDIVEDTIKLDNQLSRGINVYLFKQLNPLLSVVADPGVGTMNATIVEATYAPLVVGSGSAINLYHNLFENIGSAGSGNSWDLSKLSGTNVSTLGTGETLVTQSSKNLIYDIKVEVFPEGTYDETTNTMDTSVEAITTLKSTVLNK